MIDGLVMNEHTIGESNNHTDYRNGAPCYVLFELFDIEEESAMRSTGNIVHVRGSDHSVPFGIFIQFVHFLNGVDVIRYKILHLHCIIDSVWKVEKS